MGSTPIAPRSNSYKSDKKEDVVQKFVSIKRVDDKGEEEIVIIATKKYREHRKARRRMTRKSRKANR